MRERDWYQELARELRQESRDYRQKALLFGVEQLLIKQQQRIEQMSGQLDGSLWSPKDWRE